jgi:hypothetical protein
MTDPDDRDVANELAAIKAVADALQPLSSASQRKVVSIVVELLGIPGAAPSAASPQPAQPAETSISSVPSPSSPPSSVVDIRTLKEQKQPRTATEMAALVAYYVSELLPEEERRSVITKDDIEKFFKQAPYRLPQRLAQTLPDAARAGYFDVVERGQYKLNPVGYNLVAHGLPSGGSDSPTRASRPRTATPSRGGSKKAAAASKSATAKKPASRPRKVAAARKQPVAKRS